MLKCLVMHRVHMKFSVRYKPVYLIVVNKIRGYQGALVS